MTPQQSYLYKYAIDIDGACASLKSMLILAGNSWSGRFRRLMLSRSLVLKATVFPEFWTDWAIRTSRSTGTHALIARSLVPLRARASRLFGSLGRARLLSRHTAW